MIELYGQIVDKIELGNEGYYIRFTTRRKTYTYSAEGDCCSVSYINDLINVQALLRQEVKGVIEKDLPGVDSEDEYNCIRAYGFTLVTKAGYFDLVFRNESNGYYGGWLELCQSEPTGGNWTNITEDYAR